MFVAIDADHGQEIWVSDWTPGGTHVLKDIHPGPAGTYVGASVVYKGLLYFVADDGVIGSELWRTDGTEAGTFPLGDLFSDPYGGIYSPLIVFRDAIWLSRSRGIFPMMVCSPSMGGRRLPRNRARRGTVSGRVRRSYSPSNTGGRFSAKARSASTRSFDARQSW